jgi:hypothetical protein
MRKGQSPDIFCKHHFLALKDAIGEAYLHYRMEPRRAAHPIRAGDGGGEPISSKS